MNDTIFFIFYNLAHQSNFLDSVITFFAVYFPYVAIMLALLFLFFYRRTLKEFFIVFFSSFLAYFISAILKILFHTLRPFEAFSQVHPLFPEIGYSFPSSHAVFFSALAVSLFFCNKKVGLPAPRLRGQEAGYLFMFFAILIGVARIVAGVHFPIDILGGFILGTLVAWSLRRFTKNSGDMKSN